MSFLPKETVSFPRKSVCATPPGGLPAPQPAPTQDLMSQQPWLGCTGLDAGGWNPGSFHIVPTPLNNPSEPVLPGISFCPRGGGHSPGEDARGHGTWNTGGYPQAKLSCHPVPGCPQLHTVPTGHQKGPIAPYPCNLPPPSAPCERQLSLLGYLRL